MFLKKLITTMLIREIGQLRRLLNAKPKAKCITCTQFGWLGVAVWLGSGGLNALLKPKIRRLSA